MLHTGNYECLFDFILFCNCTGREKKMKPVVATLCIKRSSLTICCKILKLNSIFLSRPISVVNWKRALVMEMLAKAEVLEYYDDIGIQSVNDVFPLPAVMKVCFYVKNINSGSCQLNASRKSILMRDRYECQYCGSRTNLTIDHVIPISRGGEWKYDNLVTACSRCNTKKGSKLPHECRMHPKKAPSTPKFLSVGIVSCIAETVITGKVLILLFIEFFPTTFLILVRYYTLLQLHLTILIIIIILINI